MEGAKRSLRQTKLDSEESLRKNRLENDNVTNEITELVASRDH